MTSATGQRLDDILTDEWWPAYRKLCRLRAVTAIGRAIKLSALLDEHSDGPSTEAEALNLTLRRAGMMGRMC